MENQMSLQDYKKAYENIIRAVEENQQSFELALLLHEQGVSTDQTKANVTKAGVLAWVVEQFKVYPVDENTKPNNV